MYLDAINKSSYRAVTDFGRKTTETKKMHYEFWNGSGPCLIFIPTAQMPQYDTEDYEQRFYGPQKMLQAELARAEPVNDWPTDGIPSVRPNLGTIFIPAIAGQNFTIRDGQMPWAGKHHSVLQVAEMAKADIETSEIMKLAVKFYEHFNNSASTDIAAYLPDTQGVFDILHILCGTELFYELCDSARKDEIKKTLQSLVKLYTDVSFYLKKIIGESANSMIHGHGTAQGLYFPQAGVRLSEDTATLLSPDMIDEFVIPYMQRASQQFGGAFVHFCGKHDYLYEQLLKQDFVKAIDLGNPEMYDTAWLLEKCAATNTVFYGKLAAETNESWHDYTMRLAQIVRQTDVRCVLRPWVFPENQEECTQMQQLWHEMTE